MREYQPRVLSSPPIPKSSLAQLRTQATTCGTRPGIEHTLNSLLTYIAYLINSTLACHGKHDVIINQLRYLC